MPFPLPHRPSPRRSRAQATTASHAELAPSLHRHHVPERESVLTPSSIHGPTLRSYASLSRRPRRACDVIGATIERYVPALPLSKEASRYRRLRRTVGAYRSAIGQARQEDLLRLAGDADLSWAHIDLSP